MDIILQSPPVPRNRLLAALPPEDLARLWPLLTRVELAIHDVLYVPEQSIPDVYFPESGCLSMLAYLEDGDAAEVGQIGRDGMVGLPVLLGDDREDLEAMVQHPGVALRISAARFREALERIPGLRAHLLRYALVYHGQVARTGACNGCHDAGERLARWLLMTHDRAEGDTFPMTPEVLSLMLGVRRAGIILAMANLQEAGFIHDASGQITVTDRPGLESAACECYGIARRASDRLYGRPGGSQGSLYGGEPHSGRARPTENVPAKT